MNQLSENTGKNRYIEIDGKKYARLPIKTHVITDTDNICDVAEQYTKEHLVADDILVVAEKAVACAQGRAIPMEEIHPRRLAKFLCRFVMKSKHGIGLGIPETMEMALRECGTLRILFAAAISAVGKLFRQRGWFYIIAGNMAASIDGPTPNTVPPYNRYVVLGPDKPDRIAKQIAERIGCRTAIVDINDLGGKILGVSHSDLNCDLLVRILTDNPLGQSSQQTPLGIIRVVNDQ